MRHKRVFVSGGAGVIGTALVQLLLKQEAEVFVGDLKPCPLEWSKNVHYRQGDLNTLTAGELAAFAPEVFFHLAATFERSEESYPFLQENFHHNVQLSHHLLSCLQGSVTLKKVVFASSYLIYDPALYQFSHPPVSLISLQEESKIYPRNVCGAAKLFHELELRFLEHFLKGQADFVSARIFRVYGRKSRDIISRWVRMALREETLSIYRPEGKFDYIFADDVAEGLLRLAHASFNGVVNLGSGHARSVYDVLKILKKHFPLIKTQEIPSEIPFEASQADMQRFESITGWRPEHSLESAIPKIIEFERAESGSKYMEDEGSVLITSLSRKIPLIQAVRAAANKLGHFTVMYGCDSDPLCLGQYEVDHFWNCPYLKDLTEEKLIDYCQRHGIKVIIPTRDAELVFYARHQDALRCNQIHVMISKLTTIELCLDKKQFADVLTKEHFPVIPTSLSLAELEAARYVVKERYGAGSVHLRLNVSKEEADFYSQDLDHPIFQPYVEGQEWSIDVYRSQKGEYKGGVVRRRDVVMNGESQITTTVRHPKLEVLCQELAHFLDLTGHAIFQVLEDQKGHFHIIECNPRFGGASTASLAVGLDSFYWFFLECLGESLHAYSFKRLEGEIRQIRYPTDRILPWS